MCSGIWYILYTKLRPNTTNPDRWVYLNLEVNSYVLDHSKIFYGFDWIQKVLLPDPDSTHSIRLD
ncbi:MAG: hypothetical protein MUO62_16050, partial [Anaerolineales bacterium]|nr:hypothetical protein [Anaerolineales bacterium]